MDREKLAVCAVFRNEAPYLLEWLAYHCLAGVDHFVLYDNDSTDGGAALVRGSPFAERVTLINWPQRPGLLAAYRHFIDIFAPGFEWAAFVDVNEFLLGSADERVSATLDRLGHAAAALVHWRLFGPSGWTAAPDGLVIENYDMRAPDDFPLNRHVRTIARCRALLDVTQNPREFMLQGVVVNTCGHAVPNSELQESACHDALAINRYHTYSRQEWLAKLLGNRGLPDDGDPALSPELIESLDAACQIKDTTIQRWAADVRVLLGLGPAVERMRPLAADTRPPHVEQAATLSAVRNPVEDAPGWVLSGPDGQEHESALIFRDRARTGAPWLAALRGAAAGMTDPDFLLDDAGRIKDFGSDADARAACEAALKEM